MISCPNTYSFLWMEWKGDSLLWENVHVFMQTLIYNLIIVLNYTRMYFYYNFEDFFLLDSCPLPAACSCFENAGALLLCSRLLWLCRKWSGFSCGHEESVGCWMEFLSLNLHGAWHLCPAPGRSSSASWGAADPGHVGSSSTKYFFCIRTQQNIVSRGLFKHRSYHLCSDVFLVIQSVPTFW